MNGNRIAPLALYQEVAGTTARTNLSGTTCRRAPGSTSKRSPSSMASPELAARGPQGARIRGPLHPGMRRGCYVTEISERDLDEIFRSWRCSKASAADTAPQGRQRDLRALQALHDKLEAAAERGDIEGFFESNQLFHEKFRRSPTIAGSSRLSGTCAR